MLDALLHGGNQERSLRPGTENVAGVVGFATALTIATDERKIESHRLTALRDRLEKRLVAEIPNLVVNGHLKRRSPHILHVSVPGLDGERAVFALDQAGVMAATGSACAANSGERSHVLTAVGFDDAHADGSLRFSLGRTTSEKQIDEAAAIIIDTVHKERSL